MFETWDQHQRRKKARAKAFLDVCTFLKETRPLLKTAPPGQYWKIAIKYYAELGYFLFIVLLWMLLAGGLILLVLSAGR
jgi:hypothetical protein